MSKVELPNLQLLFTLPHFRFLTYNPNKFKVIFRTQWAIPQYPQILNLLEILALL